MPRSPSPDERCRHEIEHHRTLAAGNPEDTWGWGSPAGRIRGDRRGHLLVACGRIALGARVLELGCGTGEFTRRVTFPGCRLVALDLSAELLALAVRKVGKAAGFVRGDAETLPFSDGAFDVVSGCSVLHHLDVDAALREIRRVLRPGGRLVFSEPDLLNPQSCSCSNADRSGGTSASPKTRWPSPEGRSCECCGARGLAASWSGTSISFTLRRHARLSPW